MYSLEVGHIFVFVVNNMQERFLLYKRLKDRFQLHANKIHLN